jgi:tol-pal system protein YbgF
MRNIELRQRFRAAAFMAAALLVALPGFAAEERLPLSERVARLEQQAQGNQQSVELLNRVNELQQEVQSLRGTIEQMNNEIERLKKVQRDQYLDLDSRINRLGGPGQGASAQAPADGSAPQLDSEPVDGGAPPPREIPPPRETAPPGPPPRATDAPANGADFGNEKAAYDEAFGSLREGRYAESARRFREFLDQYPDSDLSDNAHYWLGESYYVTQNYKVALETFQTVLKRYPQSPKAPDALLKIGYCQFELKDWANAEAMLNDVIRRYPDTTVSRLAEGRLRALRMEPRR